MTTWFRAGVRLIACLILTLVLWWIGGRLIGVYFGPGEAVAAFLGLGLVLLIGIVWAVVLGRPLANWIGEKAGASLWMPSDVNFEWRPQYSIAEARVREGRYQEAIEAFRVYTVQYPAEIIPHLRIADLQLERFDNAPAAIEELQAGLLKARGPDATAFIHHRLADLYLKHGKDPVKALECLRDIQRLFPKTRQAKTALQRAEGLLMRGKENQPGL